MEEKDIEQEIQAKGLTAPRITPADIEANIASVFYFTYCCIIGVCFDKSSVIDSNLFVFLKR